MKTTTRVILLFMMSTVVCQGQSTYINRGYVGASFFGDVPLFDFLANKYPAGLGGSVAIYTSKITLSDSQKVWLRFGASICAGAQNEKTLMTPAGTVKVNNGYHGLNLIARVSVEKHKRWRPFGEFLIGKSIFESQFRASYGLVQHPVIPQHNTSSPTHYGIAGGYMLRLSDAFLFEWKLTYLQCFKKIDFIAGDRVVNDMPNLRHAVPSLLMFQLGFLVRIPQFSRGTNTSYEPSTPQSPNQEPYHNRPIPEKSTPKKEGSSKYKVNP